MNLQRKLIFSLAVCLSFGAFAAEEKGDLKWGVTLGVASLDYESERPGDGYTLYEDATYRPFVFGIDVGRGKHSVSYKITSAGDEDYNPVRDPASDFVDNSLNRVTVEGRDHKETTITYQYQLERFPGWGLGIQYNDVENKYSGTQKADYEHYYWDGQYGTDAQLDGWGFFGTYVRPIQDTKWVFAAKLGVALTDYEASWQYDRQINTTDSYYDVFPNLDGSTLRSTELSTGDASSAIIGLTMAYVASPKSVVYFNFDTRVDDFGELNVAINPTTGTGYWENYEEGDDFQNSIELAAGLEETNWKFAIEWRYSLN
jgi:hypothetical protein